MAEILVPLLPAGWKFLSVGGGVTLNRPDGTVVSIQPGGAIGSRPAGTAGVWEVAQLSGLFVTYTIPYDDAAGHHVEVWPFTLKALV